MEKKIEKKFTINPPDYTTFSYYYVRRTSVYTTDSRISDCTTRSERITLSILMIPVKLFIKYDAHIYIYIFKITIPPVWTKSMATTCNFIDNDFYRSWARKSDMLNEESWLENLVSPYKWLSFLFDQQRVQGSSFWLLDGKVGSGPWK